MARYKTKTKRYSPEEIAEALSVYESFKSTMVKFKDVAEKPKRYWSRRKKAA